MLTSGAAEAKAVPGSRRINAIIKANMPLIDRFKKKHSFQNKEYKRLTGEQNRIRYHINADSIPKIMGVCTAPKGVCAVKKHICLQISLLFKVSNHK